MTIEFMRKEKNRDGNSYYNIITERKREKRQLMEI